MIPPAERAQAERFADALAALDRGAALGDVLASVGDDRDLVALVRVAADASAALPATLDDGARQRQRAYLSDACGRRSRSLAVAPIRGSEGRRRAHAGRTAWPRTFGLGWPQLALRLTAAVVAVSLGFGSAVVASADDVPGDALYPVKRAAESARLALTFDSGRRVAYHLELATLRLTEIRALINRGRNPSARIVEALIAQLSAAESEARAAVDSTLLGRTRVARDAAAGELRRLADDMPDGESGAIEAGIRALDPPSPDDGLPAAVPTSRADRRAPADAERPVARPSPTWTSVPAGLGAAGRATAAPRDGAATAPPLPADPTAAATASSGGAASDPGAPSPPGPGSGEPGGPGAAPSSEPPPAATDAPPPAEPPAVEPPNARADERATALAANPPKPTPQPTAPRPRRP